MSLAYDTVAAWTGYNSGGVVSSLIGPNHWTDKDQAGPYPMPGIGEGMRHAGRCIATLDRGPR